MRAEDDRRYRAIIEPFWSGAQDSTKIGGFAEEQHYIRNIYSHELSSILYEAANGYVETLPPNDPALRDALAWAARCDTLTPGNEAIQTLINMVELRLREVHAEPGRMGYRRKTADASPQFANRNKRGSPEFPTSFPALHSQPSRPSSPPE